MKNILLFSLVITLNAFSQSFPVSFLNHFKHSSQIYAKTQKTSTIINLKDSTYTWSWDISTSNWDAPDRTIYTYNAFYKENSTMSASWNGASWPNGTRTTGYTYDGNNNILTKIYQYWNSTTWINSLKIIYTYDASNNELSSINQNWNSGTLAWENSNRSISTYDASNNLLTVTTQNWNAGISAWDNANKSTATYNANKEYTSYEYQTWNAFDSTWENNAKIINITYSGGDLIGYEQQIWNTSTLAFEPVIKVICTYDGNHHMLSYLYQSWESSFSLWMDSNKGTYTYDSNGNQITLLDQTRDIPNSAWIDSYRQYDYYTTLVGLNELTTQNNIIAYPNPLAGELIIESKSGDLSSNYVLLDELGRTTFKGETHGIKTTINTSGLAKGLYTLTLTNDKGIVKSVKLIK